MGVHVTPEQLSAAGTRILAAADGLHGDISTLDGTAAGLHGANGAFAVARAAADCETGWEDALRPLGARVAVGGDNLVLHAKEWANTESTNTANLKPR